MMHPSLHSNQWAAGPSTHNKTYASSLQEQDSLFYSYEHLTGVPNSDEGLTRLRKIASFVKPIMRKRGWQVRVLTEFMPETANLLGLNVNKGYKICIRLRYSHSPGTFLPFEQTVDTMLHELSHIVWGPHDANFHALWDELRNEYETLLMRGYTGEGFLTKGNRLGGGHVPPQSEIRRLARANAEKRRVLQKGSGQRVGGVPLPRSIDIRKVIADAAERRNKIDQGCASGRADVGRIADYASQQTFKTKAEEDDANNRAIAEALLDLMEEDEMKETMGTFTSPPASGGLAWHPDKGLYSAEDSKSNGLMSEEEQLKWALQESMQNNGHKFTSSLKDAPQSGEKRSERSLPSARPELRPAKRSKSHLDTSNVLRFQNPDALQKGPNLNASLGSQRPVIDLSDDHAVPTPPAKGDSWTCDICTCINPLQYLACDACAVERPHSSAKVASKIPRKPVPPPPHSGEQSGWYCRECATFMEHKWWTCSGCGLLKDTS